jgi:murein DD-endopeptidase MepM/ murein hydrolase activator NlpD
MDTRTPAGAVANAATTEASDQSSSRRHTEFCSHNDRASLMRNRQAGWSDRVGRRSRPSRKLLLVVLLAPLVTGLFGAPAVQVARGDDLSNAQAQKNALQNKIADQKAAIARLNALQAGLHTEIAATTLQLNGIDADLAGTRAKVTKMDADITAVQAQYDDLVNQVAQLDHSLQLISDEEIAKAQDLATRKVLLGQRIRSAYETDRTSLLETFLSGGSFTDVLTQVGYYLDVGHQDKLLAQAIAADQATLATLHETVAETRAETDDLRAQTATQKVQLDADLVQLKSARTRLQALERATSAMLAAQKRAEQTLEHNKAAAKRAMAAAAAAQRKLQAKISKLIQDQYQRGHVPSSFNGTLSWPMSGYISQEFGCTGFWAEPPLGSCPHFHRGIDIVNAYGTRIHAAGAGSVVYCGWDPYGGSDPAFIVIIAHSRILQTWYVHLQPRCPVRAGGSVTTRTVIGYEGNTGNSTGAHLHWMVEYNGTFVNPRLFV